MADGWFFTHGDLVRHDAHIRAKALADVLDALRDDDAYRRWREALTGERPEYPPLTTRRHLADYLAERVAPPPRRRAPTRGTGMGDVPEPSNYLDVIAHAIGEICSECPMELLRIYAVLALIRGQDVTRRDVHDAWSAWRAATRPDHPSLVPFGDLTPEVQALDDPYVEAIREVSAGRAATPDGPRMWALPDEPGPEVTAVRGGSGTIYRRVGPHWQDGPRRGVESWWEILADGPLIDVTSVADGQDGDGRDG